jgi:spore coat protein CotH
MKWNRALFVAALSVQVSSIAIFGQNIFVPAPNPGAPPFNATIVRGGTPFGGATVKILDRFDANKDKWLNADERAAAREYLRTQNFRGGVRPGTTPRPPGQSVSPMDVQIYPDRHFYDEDVLRTVFLTFESTDWERELHEFHGTDVDVPATLMIDGKTYKDVGVRFRGLSSYGAVPEGQKHSMNLSLDMVHQDQAVGAYKTINLLNAHEDPTLMRAVLYLNIARQYIPAPKANFVRVVVNGEDTGLFESVQQFNKEFIRENYKNTDGARWKAPGPNPRVSLQYLGDNIDIYKQVFEIKTKDDPAQWAALMNLTKVLSQTPVDRLQAAIDPILDVDGALRFLALEMTFVNNDGYWTRASDYSIYRDGGGKFHIVPHDANETFAATPSRGGPINLGNTRLDPLVGLQDATRPLRSRLLAVPEFREKYLGYVREIATKWLDWNTLGPFVEHHRALIDEAVKADTRKLDSYELFVAGTGEGGLKAFVAARREFLLR